MAASTDTKKQGLLERLAQGPVICAEGYVFELERRGFLQAGPFVPEVVLRFPEAVRELHREFLRAGSDVIEALTYYGHREKLRIVGKEHLVEELNRAALKIAKEVAAEGNALVAGNICNTNIFVPNNAEIAGRVRAIFDEGVKLAAEAGVDCIIAETIDFFGEAELALEVILKYNLPAVITLSIHEDGKLLDGITPEDACARLHAAGAHVVGLNCARGPATMLPMLEKIVKALPAGAHVAALPVPYRTHHEQPTFQSLKDPISGKRAFPTSLDPFVCPRDEIAEFGKQALALGVRYLGICCGAGPHHIRSLAESIGRKPPASEYSPDMSKHVHFGTDETLSKDYMKLAKEGGMEIGK